MQVTVEKPDQGLEHKMTVTFPSNDLTTSVEKRLKEIRRSTKMDGFRLGKVPLKVVKQRHGVQVNQEVMSETLQKVFYDAVGQESLKVAGLPSFDGLDDSDGKIKFVARFEVYPEIILPRFSDIEVETITAEVTDKDVENMVTRLREQRAVWQSSKSGTKMAKKGEQVMIDFVGKIDGIEFDGGSAKDVPLELGSNRMIAGFEDQIVGMKKGEERIIEVTFPEDYQSDKLKGKVAKFEITVHSIMTKVLPEIDEVFVQSLGVEDGTEASLMTEIKGNMVKELSRAVASSNRTNVLDALQSVVDAQVPKSLVKKEVEALMNRALQSLQKQGVSPENAGLEASHFEEEAKKRVKLGLVLGDIIRMKNIEATDDEVNAYVSEQAASYEDPAEVSAWYAKNPGAKSEIRAILVETKVAEEVLGEAKVTKVVKTFEDVVKPEAS